MMDRQPIGHRYTITSHLTLSSGELKMDFIVNTLNLEIGGPRGRVVKVADFSALDHSIISRMWVRASHGARIHM